MDVKVSLEAVMVILAAMVFSLEAEVDSLEAVVVNLEAVVPQYRMGLEKDVKDTLDDWEKKGLLVFTPSRKAGNKAINSYDDRMILDYATAKQGIVVSRDNFRDIYEESPHHHETIEKRILMPTFVGDVLMFPDDPLGRSGPR